MLCWRAFIRVFKSRLIHPAPPVTEPIYKPQLDSHCCFLIYWDYICIQSNSSSYSTFKHCLMITTPTLFDRTIRCVQMCKDLSTFLLGQLYIMFTATKTFQRVHLSLSGQCAVWTSGKVICTWLACKSLAGTDVSFTHAHPYTEAWGIFTPFFALIYSKVFLLSFLSLQQVILYHL